jgi:hypothetical protein
MNETKQSFKDMVRSCLSEVKQERSQKERLRTVLKSYVREVLKEVISGPVPPKQDKDETEKINKGFDKQGNVPAKETQDQQLEQLTKLVHGINASFNVYRDTKSPGEDVHNKRNFLIVDAGNILSVRIKERWENNYDLEAFVHESDRIIAISLNWEQVKAFIKANFSEASKKYTDVTKKKAMDHLEDKTGKADPDLPQGDNLKSRFDSADKTKLGTTKRDDKDYKEPAVKKDEDMPDQPLKQVTKPGKDPETKNKAKDNKETPQVKPPKHKNDDELVKKMPGKKK